jgi:hypothetical protein
MAKIVILGEHCRATISEPDEDGDVVYVAECGADSGDQGPQPLDNTIAAAEIHVDRCQVSALTLHHPDYE